MKHRLLVMALIFITGLALVSCGEKSNSVNKGVTEDIITNSIGMKLQRIKPGEFMMGLENGNDDEKPVHKVKITKPFYIGVYEVTQEQYEKVMGTNPSYFEATYRPVDNVSWNDAKEFCRKLSENEGVKYRLPTEAEWEYACRAGTDTEYYWGDEMDDDNAWYDDNSDDKTHPVGTKKPNAWGLYDMTGNVYEWCEDWYDKNYYENSPVQDPKGPKEGKYRVLRGGSWHHGPLLWRTACRRRDYPGNAHCFYGFRIVRAQD